MEKKKNTLFFILSLIVIALAVILFQSQKNEVISNINLNPNLNDSLGDYIILADGLEIPWAIDFLPDGKLIFTERVGNINILENGEVKIIADLDVFENGESGLLGLAVDPNFNESNFIYVYYTTDSGNRVSRFSYKDNLLKNEEIIIDRIPSAIFHDGGRIKFGPDGYLYITTGDATNPSDAQVKNSLAGKILRIEKDGGIPKDNPFGNAVYSYGHRNPQGIAWNNLGEMFSSEHGPSRHDELNKIIIGQNYGWPETCESQDEDTIKPLRCYEEFTLAPSGIAFFNNSVFMAGLRGNQVRVIFFNEDFSEVTNEKEFISGLGRIRDVVVHDNYLYIATNNRDGRGIPKEDDDKIIMINISQSIQQ